MSRLESSKEKDLIDRAEKKVKEKREKEEAARTSTEMAYAGHRGDEVSQHQIVALSIVVIMVVVITAFLLSAYAKTGNFVFALFIALSFAWLLIAISLLYAAKSRTKVIKRLAGVR
jgi:Flp pilus assembly protein TadB